MTVIIFLIVLSVLVFVHELGHFLMARRAGMKVEEFGFGFPPKIFGIKRGDTEYTINLIPFGGFVKILGEDGDARDTKNSFTGATFWQKILVIFAGVFMNMVLALVLLWIVNIFGVRVAIENPNDAQFKDLTDKKVQIVAIAKDSPAELVGLQPFDELESIGLEASRSNSQPLPPDFGLTTQVPITSPESIQNFIKQNPGQPSYLVYRQGNETKSVVITPRVNTPEGQGAIGIQMAHTGVAKFPVHIALWRAVLYTYSLTVQTIMGYGQFLGGLFFHASIPQEVSGPIGIAVATKRASDVGFVYLLQFMAVISINLAVLNTIPFPALDGGRGLFLIIERLRGKPITKKIEGYIYSTSFFLLLALMLYITVKDLFKFF